VTVDLIIDKLAGGITLDECIKVNKVLRKLIEEQSIFPDDFSLEVASPGLDWPLTEQRDFHRVIGRDVAIFLKEPVEDKLQFDGKVDSVLNNEIVIITNKGVQKSIPLNNVQKGLEII